MSAVITALAPWFGGKRNLAATIVEEIGPHAAYWEPFCGSMAVLLAKPEATMETVNDLHADLINLARVIKVEALAIELYGRLARTLACKVLMDEAAARLAERKNGAAADEPDIDRAEDYFLTSWLGRNGVSGTISYNQGYSRRFTKNGGHAATRWIGAVESIPWWHERLRAVSVLSECGISILDRIEDADGVAIYLDPPYLVKGARYVHDFEEADHLRLAAALRRFRRTRCVVSYYDDSRLAELYPTWRRVEIEVTKSLVNQGMRDQVGATKVTEVLLINDRGKNNSASPGPLFG
jgi:DNA adenine methylase